jgi:hypothetical protein
MPHDTLLLFVSHEPSHASLSNSFAKVYGVNFSYQLPYRHQRAYSRIYIIDQHFKCRDIMLHVVNSVTYDHRTLKTRLPVRSALFKQRTGGLVVRWVTTSEYPLLYVFVFALLFVALQGPGRLFCCFFCKFSDYVVALV